MINSEEFNILQHDIKRSAKLVKIITDEDDHDKRETLLSLLNDELDRLSVDITNMSELRGQ